MARYWKTQPNLIESDEGSIRIRGRAGLDVEYRGETVRVSSEMLAPPMKIALYTRGQDAVASERAEEILQFVVDGLEFAGYIVERD
jgi:hypothetical protein